MLKIDVDVWCHVFMFLMYVHDGWFWWFIYIFYTYFWLFLTGVSTEDSHYGSGFYNTIILYIILYILYYPMLSLARFRGRRMWDFLWDVLSVCDRYPILHHTYLCCFVHISAYLCYLCAFLMFWLIIYMYISMCLHFLWRLLHLIPHFSL